MAKLAANRYGKALVRVMKLDRTGPLHQLAEWSVRVLLEGDFEEAHTTGSNANILPTDTMKNTVYSRAKASSATTPEEFAMELADFMLTRNAQVSACEVKIETVMWKRLTIDGNPHPSAFMRGSDERATVRYTRSKSGDVTMECGIENMVILKSAQSGFEGYIKDELTTLKETSDRLFATAMTAEWTYADSVDVDYGMRRTQVRETLLKSFANHDSKSVQQTLFAMAEDALAAVPSVADMHLVMPNKHCLLVNLEPFGQSNDNEIFVPTDEPHGYIEALVVRN